MPVWRTLTCNPAYLRPRSFPRWPLFQAAARRTRSEEKSQGVILIVHRSCSSRDLLPRGIITALRKGPNVVNFTRPHLSDSLYRCNATQFLNACTISRALQTLLHPAIKPIASEHITLTSLTYHCTGPAFDNEGHIVTYTVSLPLRWNTTL